MDAEGCIHCGLPVPKNRTHFCCFGCHIAYDLQAAALDTDENKNAAVNPLTLRLLISGFATLNLMVFSFLFYSDEFYDIWDDRYIEVANFLAYLQMFLCTIVYALLGLPIASDVVSRIIDSKGRDFLNVNALIILGSTAAYVLSIINTINREPQLYFETTAIILLMVSVGGLLDANMKANAFGETMQLLDVLPESDAAVGDEVSVKAGERLPVDGQVIEGQSSVDESVLTGESLPRNVQPGDAVLAGSVNIDGQLRVKAQRIGHDRTAATVLDRLAASVFDQPPLQRFADRIAAWFLPCVVLLAVGVQGYHAYHGDAQRGLFDALSVLLISCPCALGLSSPLATCRAVSRAAKRGIVFASGSVIERAARVKEAFFDKTGTITTARLTLESLEVFEQTTEQQALRLAAAIESTSLHPIAAAIERAAREANAVDDNLRVTDSKTLPGIGVQVTIGDEVYKLGSSRLLADASQYESQPGTLQSFLFQGETLIARFSFGEQVRDEAKDAITQLSQMGIASQVLTGDRPEAAVRLSEQLNIPAIGGLLPDDKLEHLRGRPGAAMIGDGINDAIALSAADVGIAMAGATDLAKQSGNVTLLADDLSRVVDVFAIARHTVRCIRWNLFWAFAYNAIGIGLAVMGLLNPALAATAMVVSSALILRIALKAGDLES